MSWDTLLDLACDKYRQARGLDQPTIHIRKEQGNAD
jgi:hypothetical protein